MKVPAVQKTLPFSARLSLNIIDVGWGPLMSAIWALPIALLMLPLFLVVNLVLIFIKFTDTMDIDLWNYALCFYGGMYVYTASEHNVLLSPPSFLPSLPQVPPKP